MTSSSVEKPQDDRQELLRRLGALFFIVGSSVCAGMGTSNAWIGWSVFLGLSALCDVPYGRAKGRA